jgi:CRISPR-associated protein Csm4
MKLHRIRVRPLSPWATPWQADTLSGLLCWALARSEGNQVLRERVLGPAAAGRPPFVVSDAFPGDLLPVPAHLRLRNWPLEVRKTVKRSRWMSTAAFQRFQTGSHINIDDLICDEIISSNEHLHNTIARDTNTTGAPGSLFALEELALDRGVGPDRPDTLSIYIRVMPGSEQMLGDLFRALSNAGFGADVSTGKGAFELASDLEPADWLDADSDGADGVVVLSTFQPDVNDSVDGCWEGFTKYGKLGPDFGVENVFKRPLVLLRPGACFRLSPLRPFLGRAIPMTQVLSKETCDELTSRNVEVLHLAFGVAVPARLEV